MEIIGSFLLWLIILSVLYYVGAAYCTWAFFRAGAQARGDPASPCPPVSVIKPVARVEEDSLDDFATFLHQDYPVYEVIFGLSEQRSAEIRLLEGLRARFPGRPLRWVIVEDNKGPNYKVGNLVAAVREARYDTLVISDSDMRVGPTYLKEVMADFARQGAGLVTCLYRGVHIRNTSSALQALFVQTDFIPNVLLDHRMEGISYAFGATVCTSKEILASLGGLESLLEYLADDYQMGNRVQKQGHSVILSPYLVDHTSRVRDFREYFLHHLRWAITQRVCRPLGYFASVITQGVSLATLFLMIEGGSLVSALILLSVCTARLLSAEFLNKTVIGNGEVSRYLWLIPFKDLLNSVIWMLSLLMNTVHWRGRRFRVLKDGRMEEL